MQNNKTKLLDDTSNCYADKLAEHGIKSCGIYWNGEESKMFRIVPMYKIIYPKKPQFFLNDLGCGYGALIYVLRSTLNVLTAPAGSVLFATFWPHTHMNVKSETIFIAQTPCRLFICLNFAIRFKKHCLITLSVMSFRFC